MAFSDLITGLKKTFSKEQLKATPISKIPQRIESLRSAQKVQLGLLIGATPFGGSVARTGGQALKSYAKANPLKAVGYGSLGVASGIVGGAALKENPQLAKDLPSATYNVLSDVGTTGGKVTKSKSFSEAFGHLKGFVQEHPIASTVGGLVAGGVVAKGIIPAIATFRQTEAIQEQTAAIQKATSGAITQSMPSMASPSYIEPATTTTSWGQSELTTTKKSYPAKRKAYYFNPVDININCARNIAIWSNKIALK